MEKIKTHITGLDTLLHGGVQLYTNTEGCHSCHVNKDDGKLSDNDSLVIVIKGARGVFKIDFALHLMHGLTVSLKQSKQRPCKGMHCYIP